MRNYTKELARSAPEGMIDWCRERRLIGREYLIFRAGYTVDPITELREKCVDAVCTACGKRMKLDYAGGCQCHGYGDAFGFRLWNGEEYKDYTSYHSLRCPECGAEVTAMHISNMRYGQKDNAWVMTLGRIPEEGRRDRLAVYCWEIVRETDKEGTQRWWASPYECYIVEEKRIVRCKHWGSNISRHYYLPEWVQTKGYTDTLGDIEHVYCPEGIETLTNGTTAENARLAEYMALRTKRYPANWLRLWLKHRNLDTVFSVGAGELVAGMIAEFKKQTRYNSYTGTNKANTDTAWLADIDWKQTRPARMLRMNAGELRAFLRSGGTAADMEKLLHLRKAGHRVEVPECLRLLRDNNIQELKQISSLAERGITTERAAGYIERQKKRYPKDKADLTMLLDYYGLCDNAGWSLAESGTAWPQRLLTAHDQALLHATFAENEKLRGRFAAQYDRLRKYLFAADGLEIVVPQREKDLIVEGKMLHHCVASYARRHAYGEVTILFIRRSEEPEKPYYTLSIYENSMTVNMDLGLRNCKATPEVKAFEEKFMAWARAGCRRNKAGEPITEEKISA